LWGKGAGSTSREMTGGRWITYRAEMHDAYKYPANFTGPKQQIKGVTAYRPKDGARRVPPVAPKR
jgi:hypothetical protein